MRRYLAGLTLAIILGAPPSVALADDGRNTNVPGTNDDPGIAALHAAITERQAAAASLRAECPDRSDAKCRAELREVHDAFKDAHQKAIAAHHAFKEAAKKARDEARQKAKDARKHKIDQLKEQAREKRKDKASRRGESQTSNTQLAKPKESPKPSATPRG